MKKIVFTMLVLSSFNVIQPGVAEYDLEGDNFDAAFEFGAKFEKIKKEYHLPFKTKDTTAKLPAPPAYTREETIARLTDLAADIRSFLRQHPEHLEKSKSYRRSPYERILAQAEYKIFFLKDPYTKGPDIKDREFLDRIFFINYYMDQGDWFSEQERNDFYAIYRDVIKRISQA